MATSILAWKIPWIFPGSGRSPGGRRHGGLYSTWGLTYHGVTFFFFLELPLFEKSLYWICYNVASILYIVFFSSASGRHVESLLPDQGSNPYWCIGRRSLNLWTTREVSEINFLMNSLQMMLPLPAIAFCFSSELAVSPPAVNILLTHGDLSFLNSHVITASPTR